MPPSAASSRLPLAALFLIVLAGGAMRLWQARESLWLDELHTAWCAVGSLAEVQPRASIGNQSPVFFWLEWLLAQSLGPSELTVRLPSLLAGTLLPAALFWLIDRWTRQPWLGVLAAWLVVVDPLQIFYATEARPYALLELLAVLHVAVLAEFLHQPKLLLRVALVLGAGLLFHLHYTTALLLVAEALAMVLVKLTHGGKVTYRWRDMALDLLLIVLLCTPALANLRAIYGRRRNWEAFVHPQPIWAIWAIFTLLPWSWTALAILAGPATGRFRPAAASDDNRPVLVSFCWLFVPLVLAWLATSTDVARLFFLRYLVASAPAAVTLTVLSLRLIPWRSVQIVLGLAIALFAVVVNPIGRQFRHDGRFIADRPDDWRSAIGFFNVQSDRDRYPVLVRSWLIEADALRGAADPRLTDYCLYPVQSLYPIDTDAARLIPLPRTDAGQLAPEVRDLVRASGGAWLILGGTTSKVDEIERDVAASLGARESGVRSRQKRWHASRSASFGNVRVVLIRPDS